MKTVSRRWLWVSLFVFGLDQASKYWISHAFFLGLYLPVTNFLNIGLFHNTGMAFSLLANHTQWARWVLSGVAGLACVILLIWLSRLPRRQGAKALAVSLILGGALGNLYDRMLYGYVIDFLDFHIHSWHWPAFNVADSAICIGVVILLIKMLREKN